MWPWSHSHDHHLHFETAPPCSLLCQSRRSVRCLTSPTTSFTSRSAPSGPPSRPRGTLLWPRSLILLLPPFVFQAQNRYISRILLCSGSGKCLFDPGSSRQLAVKPARCGRCERRAAFRVRGAKSARGPFSASVHSGFRSSALPVPASLFPPLLDALAPSSFPRPSLQQRFLLLRGLS